jgi:hypothetical protein
VGSESGKGTVGGRERGLLLAFHGLGAGESVLSALDDPSRTTCATAWREFRAKDERARAEIVAAWRAEAVSALPEGLSRLHPSWLHEALAGEGAETLRAIGASVPDPLRAGREGGPNPWAADGSALPEEARRELARLAFGWLAPLAEGGAGPLAERLCGLEHEELVAEVTRLGARTVGLSLAGAAPALRARAMVSAGEPWARVIGQASSEPVSPEERSAAAVLASTAADGHARVPAERMLAIGLVALKAQLVAEHPASPLRVAGRLPAPLGRVLAGW